MFSIIRVQRAIISTSSGLDTASIRPKFVARHKSQQNVLTTEITSSSAMAERPRELDQRFQMGGQFEAIIN